MGRPKDPARSSESHPRYRRRVARLADDEAAAFQVTKTRNAARVEMRLVPGDAKLTTTTLADSRVEWSPPRDYQETLSSQVIAELKDAASISRTERGAATITFRKR